MEAQYDAVVIGAGLGGLTAAAKLAKAGCKTLLIERNYSVGGAASTYKAGDLVIEASLHETADPRDPAEPKHHVLNELGVLDKVTWVPTGSLYEARGGPLGLPFVLPERFTAAKDALTERFPTLRSGIADILSEMEQIASSLGRLSRGSEALDDPLAGFSAIMKLAPVATGWRQSLAQRLADAFGDNEAAKCALAGNLLYLHDDPETLWWIVFAVAQGAYIGSGGCYIQGGSQRLSNALAKAFKSYGGELLLRRTVREILIDAHGAPVGVAHEGKDGDRVEVRAKTVLGNAAPAALADMLPEPARARFNAHYSAQPLSISLFSMTIGLSVPASQFGLTSYSTLLFPEWMQSLADYRRCAGIMADAPGEAMPALAVVNYAAIDSGLAGPPHPVSVVGVDALANWRGLDAEAYSRKRDLWRQALITAIDRTYPGFADSVVSSVLSTPSSISSYLGAPGGAVYGFAPLPPSSPIWNGPGRSPKTPIDGLYLASAYTSCGGYTGSILGGAAAARQVLAALPVSKK